MALVLNVKSNVKAMTRDLNKVQKRIVPKITAQVLNHTARKVKTKAKREIAAAMGIAQKHVAKRMKFIVSASRTNLRTVIIAWFMNIFAIKFGEAKGLKVDVPTFSKKFVATMPSGHKGIFSRKSAKRLPIDETSVPMNPIAETIMVRTINTFALKEFVKEFNRRLSVALRR